MEKSKPVHVAVGIIYNTHGEIFIAQRAADAHQGSLWEFPGGKVEAGETAYEALCRELLEEIGITVQQAQAFSLLEHAYPEKTVLLDIWKVTAFSGEAYGREGQAWRWVLPHELSHYTFPIANHAIISLL